MQTVYIPDLYCPIESKINPLVDIARVHTSEWIKQFGLHEGRAYDKFVGDNFSTMTARFYPTADQLRLNLANDINSLLFVVDDAMDNQTVKADLIKTRHNYTTFVEKCMFILTEADLYIPLEEGKGVFAALNDVWKRLRAISSPEWQSNFVKSIQLMFDAGTWEFENVQAGKLPTVAEFYKKRPFLGAAHISTDLISVIENIDLPDKIINHPSIVDVVNLCRNIVCLANDLFSLSKELIHGDEHNMVIIIMKEMNISLEDAILKTVNIHNSDMTKFIFLTRELPSFEKYDASLRHYVSTLGAILKGNVDWSSTETSRYSFIYGKN